MFQIEGERKTKGERTMKVKKAVEMKVRLEKRVGEPSDELTTKKISKTEINDWKMEELLMK